MGRRKISIQRINNERKRTVTFNKRKVGLIKKAIELSVLCDCDIGMVILKQGKVFQYSSSDLEQILAAHRSYEGPIESLSNDAHDMLKPGRSLPRREEFMQSKKSSVPPAPALASGAPLDPLRAQYPVHMAQMAQTGPMMQPPHLDATSADFTPNTMAVNASGPNAFPTSLGLWVSESHNSMTSDRYFIPEDDADGVRHAFESVARPTRVKMEAGAVPALIVSPPAAAAAERSGEVVMGKVSAGGQPADASAPTDAMRRAADKEAPVPCPVPKRCKKEPLSGSSDVACLPTVGTATKQALASVDIHTIKDLVTARESLYVRGVSEKRMRRLKENALFALYCPNPLQFEAEDVELEEVEFQNHLPHSIGPGQFMFPAPSRFHPSSMPTFKDPRLLSFEMVNWPRVVQATLSKHMQSQDIVGLVLKFAYGLQIPRWWMCVRIDLGYLEHLLVTNSTIEDLDFIFESVRKSRLEHLAMKKEIICSLWTKLSSTLTEASESVVDERPDPQAPLSEEDILQMRLCSHEESIVHNLIRVEARAAQGQSFIVGSESVMKQWPGAPTKLFFNGVCHCSSTRYVFPPVARLISCDDFSEYNSLTCAKFNGGVLCLEKPSTKQLALMIVSLLVQTKTDPKPLGSQRRSSATLVILPISAAWDMLEVVVASGIQLGYFPSGPWTTRHAIDNVSTREDAVVFITPEQFSMSSFEEISHAKLVIVTHELMLSMCILEPSVNEYRKNKYRGPFLNAITFKRLIYVRRCFKDAINPEISQRRPELEKLIGSSLRARFRWYVTFASRRQQWNFEEVERALGIIGFSHNETENRFFCKCNSDSSMVNLSIAEQVAKWAWCQTPSCTCRSIRS